MEDLNRYIKRKNGMGALVGIILGIIVITGIFILAIMSNVGALVVSGTILFSIGITTFCIMFAGLKIVKPKEAFVFTLFGKYYGTICEDGFYFVNPFVQAQSISEKDNDSKISMSSTGQVQVNKRTRSIPLKELTLLNEKQKVNDLDGNPIEIGVAIIWKIVDPYKAVFNVDNYEKYLSTQCDGAIRYVASSFSYDADDESDGEKTLRGSTKEIVAMMKKEIQSKVDIAGIEIVEARVAHLSYAVEIASAMLQRQQAKAIIDARKKIVEGAVTMVEMALSQLSEKEIVNLDEERKAQMVSNLLVVLCSNKDTQPIVNSGSIY